MSEIEENQIQIYNTLTKKKEKFNSIRPNKVCFYSCGPTTYDFIHIGNARALVTGDLIARILTGLGYEVNFVRNFTDVDDKIIKRANEEGRDPLEHAQNFIDECLIDMDSLGLMSAKSTPRVSETIPEIIEMIETLVKKGFAYNIDGEILYHVPKFTDYGKLSKKDLEGLEHGKRVQVQDHKKHPADFVLWKPAKEGEISWDSPWGKGRPGWHIECSGMALKFLGETIDIHHGGIDLIFPHHENEIAQSEAANGKPYVNYWCHNEFLNFSNEKMSKSLGNVITIRNFVEKYSGIVLRQIFLTAHYRKKMDWSNELILHGINDLERIHRFIINFNLAKKLNSGDEKYSKELDNIIPQMKNKLANDFNIPAALSIFFTFIRQMNRDFLDENSNFTGKKKLSFKIEKQVEKIINFVSLTLGCIGEQAQQILKELNSARKNIDDLSNATSDEKVEELIKERAVAREKKDWAISDLVRDKLKSLNVEVKDNPDGSTTWRYV